MKKGYARAAGGLPSVFIRLPADAARGLPESKGHIFYINTVLTEDLPNNLYSYRAAHPKFPDEPTEDQFFDERQFDAYCELGFEIAKKMIDYARGNEELAQSLGVDGNATTKTWEPLDEPPYISGQEMMKHGLGGISGAVIDLASEKTLNR